VCASAIPKKETVTPQQHSHETITDFSSRKASSVAVPLGIIERNPRNTVPDLVRFRRPTGQSEF